MEIKKEEKLTKQIDYTEHFKKITVCLSIIIALLFVNSILLIVSLGNNEKSTDTGNNNNESAAYDTSMFEEKTTDEVMESIKGTNMEVIFIGRAGCGWCSQFVPVLEEVQAKFGFTATYMDLDSISTADQEKLVGLDDYVKENFSYTPLVILAKDGKYVDGSVGYMDAETLTAFLNENGMSQK